MKSIHLALAAASATLAIAGAAEARDVAVSTRAVDFSDVASVDAFHRDLADAAAEACADQAAPGVLALTLERQCRRDALDAAVETVNRPLLSALNDTLDARLRLNPARPALTDALVADVRSQVQELRAEAPAGSVVR
ncbi:MAG: UrcA family protein [Hyphomonadaceae bacterium]|nr:UrcA family protein [Hyphomonadaceae bacterium]